MKKLIGYAVGSRVELLDEATGRPSRNAVLSSTEPAGRTAQLNLIGPLQRGIDWLVALLPAAYLLIVYILERIL